MKPLVHPSQPRCDGIHTDESIRRMPHTILIVDDHAGFRRSARRLLQADGFDVVGEAPDGASALTEAIRLRPDVVLLDVQLPDIDGFMVARRLAQAVPMPMIILISSREAAEYGGEVESTPTAGFINKSRLSGASVRALLT